MRPKRRRWDKLAPQPNRCDEPISGGSSILVPSPIEPTDFCRDPESGRRRKINMEYDGKDPLKRSIRAAVASAGKPSDMPSTDRKTSHLKALRQAAFLKGVDGVKAYKDANPEAASMRVDLTALVYTPKPKGYNQYLAALAHKWLTSDAAAASTNISDVQRLNADVGTACDPAKHFNEKLTPTRLAGIRAEFVKLGAPFDEKKIDTMSKVKMAAKAARGRTAPSRHLGCLGSMTGETLVRSRSDIPCGAQRQSRMHPGDNRRQASQAISRRNGVDS